MTGRPEGAVYWSPRSYGFQRDGIARSWVLGQMMVSWDTGIGKSHLGLALTGLAFEAAEADLVLIICRQNKRAEWRDDLSEFTTIRDFALYYGPKRKALLENDYRVLITTFDVVRSDVASRPEKGKRKLSDGILMDYLRGRRVLVIYDEITKLGNRGSQLYKAHQHMLSGLRQVNPGMRVYGLTATPMERDWLNAFNEMRLIWPQGMPTVAEFERSCIKKKMFVPTGPSGRVGYERIIWDEEGCRAFAARCAPRLLRKRKSDPDVREQLPQRTEEYQRYEMRKDQADLYRKLEDLAWDERGERQQVPGLSMMLRLAAGHPRALLKSAQNGRSKLARVLAETIGDQIGKCSSAKTIGLREDYLDAIVRAQGSKVILFTFFAETVLPALAEELADYPVFIYDSGSGADRAKKEFRQYSGGAVLLASDAGSDGINVPEADYIIEYETARTHSTREQRFGRGDRLGRQTPLSCFTFVLSGTVEEITMMPRTLERNEQQDIFLGDEDADGYLTADQRRQMFAIARKRKI